MKLECVHCTVKPKTVNKMHVNFSVKNRLLSKGPMGLMGGFKRE
jgi:hypothetical protein